MTNPKPIYGMSPEEITHQNTKNQIIGMAIITGFVVFGFVLLPWWISSGKIEYPTPPTPPTPSTPPPPPPLHNVLFYNGTNPDPTYGLFIHEYHTITDWHFFQYNHAYIQWLFPNQFPSRFNPSSHPLTLQQARIFRSDLTIGKNLLLSYIAFTQFMGARITDLTTGTLKTVNKDRLYKLLLVNTHNHLRLMRIMAAMSIVGMRHYAVRLVGYLGQCVEEGFKGRWKGRFQRLENVYYEHWLPYLSDQYVIRVCGIVSRQELNRRHPVFAEEGVLEEIGRRIPTTEERQSENKTKKTSDEDEISESNQHKEEITNKQEKLSDENKPINSKLQSQKPFLKQSFETIFLR